jgi:hypothetical protein
MPYALRSVIPQVGGDVPQPRARILGDAQQDAGVIGQEAPALHIVNVPYFLEMNC